MRVAWLESLVIVSSYGRKGQHNLHVRGYKEKSNIDTPLKLEIRNSIDWFSLAVNAIDKLVTLRTI